MATTKKAPRKQTRSTSRAERSRARIEETERVIRRVTRSLDVAQADLSKLGGSVGTVVSDLRRDLTKRLRDARREAAKMSKATRKDLERLQKDMLAAAKASPTRGNSRASRTATPARKSRKAATTRSSRTTGKAGGRSRAGASTRKSRTSGTSASTRRATTKKRAVSKSR